MQASGLPLCRASGRPCRPDVDRARSHYLARPLIPIKPGKERLSACEQSTQIIALSDPARLCRTFDQLPFDIAAARVYGRIYAAVIAAGRKARGRRTMGLLIAATALSNKLPLYTHNAEDFAGLESLLDIVVLPGASGASG
jgi:hypothetical protein